jgi:hypothetical protein
MNLFTLEHVNVYFKTYVEHSRKLPTQLAIAINHSLFKFLKFLERTKN